MNTLKKKSDAELKADVVHELRWDCRVNETKIGVAVDSGVVTLTGDLESYAERVAAQEAAPRVHGVRDVANDIKVKYSGTRTDADIAKAVRHAMEWDVFVPESGITSTVSNGVVTLEGEVEYCGQIDEAARAVRLLAGVQYIINKIQVKTSVGPAEVRLAITGALERHAAREARDIQFEVEDGKVVLTGNVQSYTERQLILHATKGTRGVRAIEDRLQVRL